MTTHSGKRKFRLGVLGSGRGTNLESILQAAEADPAYPAEVVLVATDVPGAPILDRAVRRGIPTLTVPAPPGRLRREDEETFAEVLQAHEVDLVVLAGFMRVLRGPILEAFPMRIVNIHPALLPSFPGLEAWKQALDYGVKVSGCTVHFVDRGVDTGPILAQRPVPVLDDDTPETLHARIQKEEHIAFPEVIRWIAEDRVRVEGRKVRVLPPKE